MSESTSVATTSPRYALARLIEERQEQVAPFLPKGSSLQAVGHALQSCALKNPALLSAVPSQLVVAVTRCLRAGLELGEEWHLLTFKNRDLSAKAGRDVFDVIGTADYKALAQMMIASGAVRYVDPQCVYERDTFDYRLGLDKSLNHLPASGNRGKLIGAYVILRLPFGQSEFHYMPIAEIDAIRLSKSKSWAKGECPPWYAMKTVIRQIAKLIPKDRRMAKALAAIEQDEAAEQIEQVPEAEVVPERPATVDEDGVDLEYQDDRDLVEEDA